MRERRQPEEPRRPEGRGMLGFIDRLEREARNVARGHQVPQGGADPVKVVKDFLPLIRHVHLKDWNGGPHWAEYCPLGQGKVDLPAVLDLLEQSKDMKIIMVELDPSAKAPLTPIETARTSKEYLQKLGYAFRS